VNDNDVINVQFHLGLGGSTPEQKLERELRRECGDKKVKAALRAEARAAAMVLQSGNMDLKAQLLSLLGRQHADFIISLLEGVVILGYQLVHSDTHQDRIVALLAFAKGQSSEPLLSSARLQLLIKKVAELLESDLVSEVVYEELGQVSEAFEPQALDEGLESLRGFLNNYEAVRDGVMMQKLHRFLMYALSLSLFEKAGVTFDSFRYSTIEREAIKRKHTAGPDFIHCIVDTTLFLIERGYQCMKTGDMASIFHSGGAYEEWFNRASTVMKQSKFLSNPEPQGMNLPSWLADLEDCIDKGKAIGRHTRTMDTLGKRAYLHMQQSLEMCKADYLSKRAAGADRRAPFGVLVYGGSGIAKSAFTKALYYHFGKLTGNDIDDEFRYVRNANDDFWSGFRSYQWCIQLDDIAYLHPTKAPQGDPSVLEMLQVVNSVPFVPNQAELEDKGRTPMRAQLVVATSNSKTLNAYHYFNCPLAIQRRLPYVITLEVKPEYARDGVFLDSDKVPPTEPGSYPDFWIITVEQVVPAGTDQATFKKLEEFSDIYLFMDWYSARVLEFRAQQDKVNTSDKAMLQVRLCTVCHRPEGRGTCEECQLPLAQQVMDVEFIPNGMFNRTLQENVEHTVFNTFDAPATEWWTSFVARATNLGDAQHRYEALVLFCTFFISFFHNALFNLARACYRCGLPNVGVQLDLFCLKIVRCVSSAILYRAGREVQRRIGRIKMFVMIAGALTTVAFLLKMSSALWMPVSKRQRKANRRAAAAHPQGNVQSVPVRESATVGRAPVDKGEQANVWYRDEFVCTAFDMPTKGLSWNALTDAQVVEHTGRNMLVLHAHAEGSERVKVNRAIALGGQLYVTNNHGLPTTEDLTVRVIATGLVEGISANLSFKLTQAEIYRKPEADVAFFQIKAAPPRKVITDLLVSETMSGSAHGFYIQRDDEGHVRSFGVKQASKSVVQVSTLGSMNVWKGFVSEPTRTGDCGSALLLRNASGVFLAGMHVAGCGSTVAATPLTRELVDCAIAHFKEFMIQSGQPLLSAPSAQRKTTALHGRSPFRFIPNGVATVYGSFVGARGGGKSKVTDSLLRFAAEARGYVVKTAAPAMRGWEPWYNAAKEMINPVTQLRGDVLERVKQEFLADIKARVDMNQLKEEVFVYDNVTAVNGANGVRFVDKMNRATSMGCPWKKTKKGFLEDMAPTATCADPKMFTAEVMDRVDEYIENYKCGTRCMPVFSGSLKDEALKQAKVDSKSTRVFCASPADWNTVVRKYYLSFIRFMQLNRFIFEASIGCVAQSREWEDIQKFITRFGDNRMIAGDYKAFDKRMPATVILAAFDIIREVCRLSGNFTDEDLKVMTGVAFDTAFPLVDLNGDLVEFFGSNPSGHPLTVVINSLVNSLYVRYSYAILNPAGETAADFKENVALQTYGDDNVMGVSSTCTWFNHTSLANALASVGIVYTMADKEAVSVPFIHISQVSFLKRVWRYDSELDALVCPLDEDSIAKMLTKCIPSRTVTLEKQAIDVLSTVTREYFWYGREVFEKKRRMCIDIAVEVELEHVVEASTFPSWDELKLSFDNASASRLHCKW
jgi:hypothetical protein